MDITIETSIVGKFEGTWQDLCNQFIRINPHYDNKKLVVLAQFYIKWGTIFNLRADIAWAQMEKETNYLRYTGDVKPEQNNFAGIGATGGGNPGNSYKSVELGVIGHFSHLAWYMFPNHVNAYCSKIYDPRHFGWGHYKYRGPELKYLSETWAVGAGGYVYSEGIAAIANTIAADNLIEKFDLIIQMGHVGRIHGFTGTAGEQAFTKALGSALYNKFAGDPKIRLMGADDWLSPQPNLTKLFFTLHCDGAWNKNARDISVAYPDNSNDIFSYFIKNNYKILTGFNARPDNYTRSELYYYAWNRKHVAAEYYCLLEHGFMTNIIERDFMVNNIDKIAICHYETITTFLSEY